MSNRCNSPECLNGNCVGCKDGVQFCDDPRCYPNCPGCENNNDDDVKNGKTTFEWVLIALILVAALVLLGLFLWDIFSDRTSADVFDAPTEVSSTSFSSVPSLPATSVNMSMPSLPTLPVEASQTTIRPESFSSLPTMPATSLPTVRTSAPSLPMVPPPSI